GSAGKRSLNAPPSMMRSRPPAPSVCRENHQSSPSPPASNAVADPASPKSNATDRSERSENLVGVSPCSRRTRFWPPPASIIDASQSPYGYPEQPSPTSNAAHASDSPSQCCTRQAVEGSR